MKYLFALCCLFFITACSQSTESGKTDGAAASKAKTNEQPSKEEAVTEEVTELPDHGYDEAIANGIDPGSGLPLDVIEAIDFSLSGWRIIDFDKWVDQGFLDEINGSVPEAEKITYEQNVFVQADFNGDGYDDFCALVQDASNKAALYVFQHNGSNYDAIEVMDEGVVDACCLGMALQVAEPGAYQILAEHDIAEEIQLDNPGYFYFIPEKSAMLGRCGEDGNYQLYELAD